MANAILKDGWIYAGDSATDSIARENGEDLVGGTKYEIYGMAVRYTDTSFDFAISTNLPASGVTNYEGEQIYPGDVFLNFGDQSSFNAANGSADMYAIRFTGDNEAGVDSVGVYSNVTATSVALRNGLSLDGGLAEYNTYVTSKGGTPSIGTLPADTPYFDQFDPNSVPNVIASGTLVSGIVNPLTQVPNFNNVLVMEGIGSNTLGGSVDRSILQTGPVTITYAQECNNDVIAVEIDPDISIIKKTNGFDAKIPGEAVVLNPGDFIEWSFEVSNTGNISFLRQDIKVLDTTLNVRPFLDRSSDIGNDGILSPGETWTYFLEGEAFDLGQSNFINPITGLQKVTIDFEVDAFGNPLAAGTIIDDEYSALGMMVTTHNFTKNPSMIFDAEILTKHDPDLYAPDEGNILIISENANSTVPNDRGAGGTIILDFDYLVNDFHVGLFDIDEKGAGPEVTITGYRKLGEGNYQQIDRLNIEGGPGEGFRPEVDLLTDLNGFDRVEIWFKGSGAITDFGFDRIVPVFGNTAQVTLNGLAHISDTDNSYYQNGPVYNSPLMQPISLAPTAVI